jgi:hypothetical protein
LSVLTVYRTTADDQMPARSTINHLLMSSNFMSMAPDCNIHHHDQR